MPEISARSFLEDGREVVLVGDVHGRGSLLIELLRRLGWRSSPLGWKRPDGARLLFLGDLIDRGDENELVMDTVRDLVEAGHALCLMGNHEYNAVLFHTPDSEGKDTHLRPRIDKNIAQHQAVLDEFAGRGHLIRQMVNWFKSLPLAVECDGFRAVHACWARPDELAHLEEREGAWFIGRDRWPIISRSDGDGYETIQTVLKGPEIDLPRGVSFQDKDGYTRKKARMRWWHPSPRTWSEAVVLNPATEGFDLSTPYEGHPGRYSASDKPVFFGHYWKDGGIEIDAPNAACLDYSVGRGGPMVAYRFGGERELTAENFLVAPPA